MTSEKAPERIWAAVSNPDGKYSWGDWDASPDEDDEQTEYIRADVSDALVAAAYEAAAKTVHDLHNSGDYDDDPGNVSGAILYLTPDDASAALEARDRQTWNAAIDAALTTYDAEWRENTATKRAAIAALKKENP